MTASIMASDVQEPKNCLNELVDWLNWWAGENQSNASTGRFFACIQNDHAGRKGSLVTLTIDLRPKGANTL